GDKSRVTSHVLGDFAKADHDWLDPLLSAMAGAAGHLAGSDDNRFMTAVSLKLAPPRKPAPEKNETAAEAKPREPGPEKTKTEGGAFSGLKSLLKGGKNDS